MACALPVHGIIDLSGKQRLETVGISWHPAVPFFAFPRQKDEHDSHDNRELSFLVSEADNKIL